MIQEMVVVLAFVAGVEEKPKEEQPILQAWCVDSLRQVLVTDLAPDSVLPGRIDSPRGEVEAIHVAVRSRTTCRLTLEAGSFRPECRSESALSSACRSAEAPTARRRMSRSKERCLRVLGMAEGCSIRAFSTRIYVRPAKSFESINNNPSQFNTPTEKKLDEIVLNASTTNRWQ